MDAGISAGEAVLLDVNTGIQPIWAVCVFIALLLVCMVITIWYSHDSMYGR